MYQENDIDSLSFIRVEFTDNTGYNVKEEHWNMLATKLEEFTKWKEDQFVKVKLLNGSIAMIKLSSIQSISTSTSEGRDFNIKLNRHWEKKSDPDKDEFEWK